jgi:hypothetical protein
MYGMYGNVWKHAYDAVCTPTTPIATFTIQDDQAHILMYYK